MRYVLVVAGVLSAVMLASACRDEHSSSEPNASDMEQKSHAEMGTAGPSVTTARPHEGTEMDHKPTKPGEDEWKSKLTPLQYAVTRCSDTEPAFTGEYWNHKGDGVYACVCCGAPLFDSSTKFNSGTGWPSFFLPKEKAAIAEHADRSHGMVRTEVKCSKCCAHLGHLFDDGPAPSGMRYCINSASLKFKDRKDAEPKP